MSQKAVEKLLKERMLARQEFQSMDCLGWAARLASTDSGGLRMTSVKLYEGESERLDAIAAYLSVPGQRVTASGIIRAATRLFADAALDLIQQRLQLDIETAAAIVITSKDQLHPATARRLKDAIRS